MNLYYLYLVHIFLLMPLVDNKGVFDTNVSSPRNRYVLRQMSEDMYLHTIHALIIDFFEDLQTLFTNVKDLGDIGITADMVRDTIDVIENDDMDYNELLLIWDRILNIIETTPIIKKYPHLYNHIVVDLDKVNQFLNASFEEFVAELSLIHTYKQFVHMNDYYEEKSGGKWNMIYIFLHWYDIHHNITADFRMLTAPVLRNVLLERLKLERPYWTPQYRKHKQGGSRVGNGRRNYNEEEHEVDYDDDERQRRYETLEDKEIKWRTADGPMRIYLEMD